MIRGPRPTSALGACRYDTDQLPSGGSKGSNSQLRVERGSGAQLHSGRLEVRENGSIWLCGSSDPYGDRSSRTPGGVEPSSSSMGRSCASRDARCPPPMQGSSRGTDLFPPASPSQDFPSNPRVVPLALLHNSSRCRCKCNPGGCETRGYKNRV